MINLNYISDEEVKREYLIHTDSVDILHGGYVVNPVYLIVHNYPLVIMESLR